MDKVAEEHKRDLDKTDAPKYIAKLHEIGEEATIKMQIGMDWVYESVFFFFFKFFYFNTISCHKEKLSIISMSP